MRSEGRKRSAVSRAGPKGGDFRDLALLSKALGALVVVLAGLITLMTVTWHGAVGIGVGVLLLVLGFGLARFKAWAWYLGVAVLVPVFGAGGILGAVLIASGIVQIASVALVASAFYVAWVLLSKGGRKRYREVSELMAKTRREGVRPSR